MEDVESITAIAVLDTLNEPVDVEPAFWLGRSRGDGGRADNAPHAAKVDAEMPCPFEFPPKRRRGRRPLTTDSAEPIRRAEDVVEGLRTTISKRIKAYIEIGHALSLRKREIGHGEFCRLFKGNKNQIEHPLEISLSRAQVMMRVARDQRVTRHFMKLPTDLDTVDILTQLSTQEFEDGVASGKIHENLTRREAKAWISSRCKPSDGGNKPKKTKKVVPSDAMKQEHVTEPVRRLGIIDSAISKKVQLAVWSLLDEFESANQRVAVLGELQRVSLQNWQ